MAVTTGPVLLTSVRPMTMCSITLLSIRKIPRQFLYQRGACRTRVRAIFSALATEVRIGKPYPECVASRCELWQLLLPILRSWWLAPWMVCTAARMVAAHQQGHDRRLRCILNHRQCGKPIGSICQRLLGNLQEHQRGRPVPKDSGYSILGAADPGVEAGPRQSGNRVRRNYGRVVEERRRRQVVETRGQPGDSRE